MILLRLLPIIYILNLNVLHFSFRDFNVSKNFISSSPPITITLNRTFDFNSEEFIVGEVGPIFIDSLNRVFVGDTKLTKIHVFDTDGTFIKSLGNQGKGPGDFSYITRNTDIHFNKDTFYITDTFQFFPYRAHVYQFNDLSFSHTINLTPSNKSSIDILTGYEIFRLYQINENSILVSMHKTLGKFDPLNNRVYWMTYDVASRNINPDPILTQKGVRYVQHNYEINNWRVDATHSFPFFSKPLHFVRNNGVIYTANSEKLSITKTDFFGNYINSFEYPVSSPHFERSWVRDLYIRTNYMPSYDRNSGERIIIRMLDDLKDVPERWPEMEQFYVDELNRIWVNIVSNPNEYKKWIIFNDSGEFMMDFNWNND